MGKLFQEFQRRKVFRVAGIYIVAAWAVIQVADTVSPIMNLPESVPRLVLVMLVILFPAALCLAWFFQITKDGIKVQTGGRSGTDATLTINQSVSYAVIGLLGTAAITFAVSRVVLTESPASVVQTEISEPELTGEELVESMRSIAVLPFENFSTDEETGFFAQGLSEEILDQLVENGGLNIASRTASFQVVERGEDLEAIAEQLEVAYILEGSVRRLGGDDLRVTAQLIRAGDGFHIWSKTYQESFSDGFDMQSAVAANVAFVAGQELAFDVWRNYAPIVNEDFAGIDPQALEYYFDAEYEYLQFSLGERSNHGSYERYYRLATETDPGFALAYKELAWYYHQRLDRSLTPDEASLKARGALEKALELEPDNIELQFQLAQIYLMLDWNLAGVMDATEQFLSVEPNCPYCYLFQSYVAKTEGRNNEYRELRNISFETAQGNEKVLMALIPAFAMIFEGETELVLEIVAEGLNQISDGPTRVNLLLHQATANIQLGNLDGARTLIEEAWAVDNASFPEFFIYLYASTGQDNKARAIIDDPNRELYDLGWLALAYLSLGEVDKALELIELGIEDRNLFLAIGLRTGVQWDALRDDPRFVELIALMESMTTYTERYQQEESRIIL